MTCGDVSKNVTAFLFLENYHCISFCLFAGFSFWGEKKLLFNHIYSSFFIRYCVEETHIFLGQEKNYQVPLEKKKS